MKWVLPNCSHAGIRCWAEIAQQRSHFFATRKAGWSHDSRNVAREERSHLMPAPRPFDGSWSTASIANVPRAPRAQPLQRARVVRQSPVCGAARMPTHGALVCRERSA